MIVVYFSILFVSLFGIYKIVVGKTIIEVNADLHSVTFEVAESGFYSIWIEGKSFKAASLDVRNAIISHHSSNKIKSIKSIFHPQLNGIKKVELY